MAILARTTSLFGAPLPVGPILTPAGQPLVWETGNAAQLVLETQGGSGTLTLQQSVGGQSPAASSWRPLEYSLTPGGPLVTGAVAFVPGTRLYMSAPISAIQIGGAVTSVLATTGAHANGVTLWGFASPFANTGPITVDLTADFAALEAELAVLLSGPGQVQLLDDELNLIDAVNGLPVKPLSTPDDLLATLTATTAAMIAAILAAPATVNLAPVLAALSALVAATNANAPKDLTPLPPDEDVLAPTVLVGAPVDQGLPGQGASPWYVQGMTNPAPVQSYRSGVTAADLLTAGTVTTALAAGGSLATSAMVIKCVWGNQYGRTTSATGTTRTPSGGNLAIRVTPTVVTGATYVDIYLSTDADPKFIGRVTAAQLAAGGILASQNVVTAGGVAGSIDVQVVGTGLQSNTTAAINTAYTPASVPALTTAPYNFCDINFNFSVAGDSASLACTIIPFYMDALDGLWHAGDPYLFSFGGVGSLVQALQQTIRFDCRGRPLAVLVQSIAGTGAAVGMNAVLS